MTFPDTTLDLKVAAAFGANLSAKPNTWAFTDLSAKLGERQIQITRGGRDGTSVAPASSAQIPLDDDDGDLMPLYPIGAYYPHVVRGLPLHIYRGQPSYGAANGDESATTSHVAPSVDADVAGSLLLCCWLGDEPGSYTLPGSMTAGPAETVGPFSTMATATEAIAASGATGTRTATYSLSENYTSASVLIHGSGIVVEESLSGVSATGRVTLTTASTTEAGWWLVAFHGLEIDNVDEMADAPADAFGGWIPLADSFTGVKHVKAWARRVTVAGAQEVTFLDLPPTVTFDLDNHAALYVLSGVDSFDSRACMFAAGFNPSITPTTGVPRVVQHIRAAGLLERLESGSSPAQSAIKRFVLGRNSAEHAVAYWPCEDGADAALFGSALPSGSAATASGSVTPGGFSDFPGSEPIPLLGSGGSIRGDIPAYAGGAFFWRSIHYVPGAGLANGQSLLDINATGTGRTWRVRYGTGDILTLQALDSTGAVIDQTTPFDFTNLISDKRFLLSVEVQQNGSDCDVLLFVRSIADDNTTGVTGQVAETLTGVTVGRATRFVIGSGGGLSGVAAGHLMLGSSGNLAFGLNEALVGNIGESAGRRAMRIAYEEGFALHVVGDPDDTEAMGPQPAATPVEILRACEAADRGILGETRQDFALFLLTRKARYNRPIAMTIDLSTYKTAEGTSGQVLAPVYDTQTLRNEWEVSRPGGSSVRVRDTESQSQSGRYDDSAQPNLEADDRLDDIAGFLLSLTTVDEMRHPRLPLDLAANPDLIAAWEGTDIGSRVQRTNPPTPPLAPAAIDQVVMGYTESLGSKTWSVTGVGVPSSPLNQVGVYGADDADSRYDSDHSTLASDATAAATSLSVATEAGHALWTTDVAQFPFDINVSGIRITVTAISGASSPQTFTVTRSVDGVDKALTAGDKVSLWDPARYGL